MQLIMKSLFKSPHFLFVTSITMQDLLILILTYRRDLLKLVLHAKWRSLRLLCLFTLTEIEACMMVLEEVSLNCVCNEQTIIPIRSLQGTAMNSSLGLLFCTPTFYTPLWLIDEA